MTGEENQVRAGWTGRFYEDLAVGDVYRSRWGHTVTEADNALFTHLTHNTNPLHFDARYAAGSRWGRILVNSTFTLALITGMSVNDVTEHAMANLGWEEIKLPNPVFLGDTLYCETEILARRGLEVLPGSGHRAAPVARHQPGRRRGARLHPQRDDLQAGRRAPGIVSGTGRALTPQP